MKKRYIHQPHTEMQKGFTLIELLVSLTLFTIIALAMVTTLLTVNAAWKRAQSMRTVLDNLNFAIESVSRTIRTANTISCGSDNESPVDCTFASTGASGGSTTITLNSTLGQDQKIRYSRGINSNGTHNISKSVNTGTTWSTPVALTSSQIDVTNLSFYVQGSSATDQYQTNVIMMVEGTVSATGQSIPFAIQTYTSQRNSE